MEELDKPFNRKWNQMKSLKKIPFLFASAHNFNNIDFSMPVQRVEFMAYKYEDLLLHFFFLYGKAHLRIFFYNETRSAYILLFPQRIGFHGYKTMHA